MNVSAAASAASVDAALSALPTNPSLNARDLQMPPREVARQFEAVLVRQMMQETMKPLLENGQSGQVYGYFIADALSESFTKAGGFGLQSVLEAQLFAQRARDEAAARAGSISIPLPSLSENAAEKIPAKKNSLK